ncbi:MAG TPA: single-stranded DNA-binding protein [Candidatus Poseidoniales archaeon]|nr:MAG TPA: single-stranded DNA-binding protein [Candidatus Poseidoniales archaeon]HII26861.1 single-stranded DNA-binding protein [Poseidonia sp.]
MRLENHYQAPTSRRHVANIERLKQAAKRLSVACDEAISKLEASGSVAHATNPLDYAWPHHEQFIEQWGGLGATTLLLGMNPGPWGMAQTGVPFGATHVARDFLRIEAKELTTPVNAHPKRPIVGMSLERQEVSGTRLWNLMEELYGSPEVTFAHLFVVNHCPLLLLGDRGQNITPDKVPKALIEPVLEACDEHLREVVDILGITRIVGVGKYAEARARQAFNAERNGPGTTSDGTEVVITTCWHPSPASPLANRNDGADWRENVRNVLIG